MGTEADIIDISTAIQTMQSHVNGIGVVVGSLFVSVSAADASSDRVKFHPVTSNAPRIPPSALLPRLAGEPLRLDSVFPPHSRGLGDLWPLESALTAGEQGARFPLAYALQEFAADQEQQPWTWTTPEGELKQLKSSEAVAGAFAAATADLSSDRGPYTLVIPNHLQMLRQQELVVACRHFGRDVKLLWRPVAGALVWCRQFGEDLLRDGSPDVVSAGTLLCIHLGIDGFELATLELVVKLIDGKQSLLPARRRSPTSFKPFLSEGLELLHRLADTDSIEVQPTPTTKWRKLWGSPWAIETVKKLTIGACGVTTTESIHDKFWKLRHSKSDDSWRNTVWAGDRISTATFEQVWNDRLAKVQEEISKHRIVGAVITGELASLPVSQGLTRAQTILSDLRLSLGPDRILIDDEATSQHSLLADGAALYSALLVEGQPTYLDTLPRIQLAAYITGTPGWIPLLNEADAYVDGGKVWHRPTPVSGLRALSGSDHLEVTLSHEEFATARKINSKYPQKLAADMPIKLSVSVEPAQGNALVEIVPEQPALFGSRRLFLKWQNMEVLPEEPDEWLAKNLPTLFPELLKRPSSEMLWRNTLPLLKRYCMRPAYTSPEVITEKLRCKQDAQSRSGIIEEAKATAVNSDGQPGSVGIDNLREFVSTAISRLLSDRSARDPNLVRAVGYTSTADPVFQRFLADALRLRGSTLAQHELAACGWCLRDPTHIAAFAEKFEGFLLSRRQLTGANFWLKAFGEMLRYRGDATRDIPSHRCEKLTKIILRFLVAELEKQNLKFVFGNSVLCITFMLRRRAFDDEYLKPGSSVYLEVRPVVTRAMEQIPSHGIGGNINPRKILQLLIDYLDRKGPSVLAGGIELRNLVE